MEVSQLSLQPVIQPGWSNNDRHATETTSPVLMNKPPSVSSSSDSRSKGSSFEMPADNSSYVLDEPVEKNEDRPLKNAAKTVQEWMHSSNRRSVSQQPSSGLSDKVKTAATYFDASFLVDNTMNVLPHKSQNHLNVRHEINAHNKNSPVKTFVSDLPKSGVLDSRSMTVLPSSDEVHQHTQNYSSFHLVNTKPNDVPHSLPEFPDNTPPLDQVEAVGVQRTTQESETNDPASEVTAHRTSVRTPNPIDPNSVHIANVQYTSKNEPYAHCTTVATLSCDELWSRDQPSQTYNLSFHHSNTPASCQRMGTVLAASFHRADGQTAAEVCLINRKRPTEYDEYTSSVPLHMLCGSPDDILSPETIPFGYKQRSQSQSSGPNSDFIPESSVEYFNRPEVARFAHTERLMEAYNNAEASVYQNRLFNPGPNHGPSLIPTQLFTAPSAQPPNPYVADSSYAKTGIDGLSCPNSISSPWDTSLGSISFRPHTNQPTDLNTARRRNATRESTATLKAWLQEHIKNPYPTKGEKIMLAIITKMTLTQVSTWFANARRRLKKENKMTWTPKHRGEDVNDDDEAGSEEEFNTLEEETSAVAADTTEQEQAYCKTKLVSFCPSSDRDVESPDGVLSTTQPDQEMLQCRAECDTLGLKHKKLFQNEMSCSEFESRQSASTRNRKPYTSRLTSEPFDSHATKVRLVETDGTQSDDETTEESVHRTKQEMYSKPNSMKSVQGISRINTPESMYCARPVISDNTVIRNNWMVGGLSRSHFPCLSPRILNGELIS
ncbi:hypothetical protein EG68_02815 [Paragonimus skrjabini miyazakii]|uniref:Homeobox domain-containing protein n=1 Tax=Paragonimus skrjabini miyazakii TaxID=59628 RepID=A0A8S9Z2Y8_9TREM|nr:hypothetical protein EG68_02815 [Paragonimus skrjabini miyazakii]